MLDLSAKIDFHVYHAICHSDCRCAVIDVSALGELYTAATIHLAMRLAGYGTRVSARKMLWTDAPEGQPAVKVALKAEDFENG